MMGGAQSTTPGGGAIDMRERNAVIAIYRNHELATGAVRSLIRYGVDRSRLSMIARDRLAGDRIPMDDHPNGLVKSWVRLGVFGPGLWGLVMGWTSVWVPGVGPLLIGGWMVSLMLGSSDTAAVFGRLTPLGVGLYRVGIPKMGICRYEEAVRRGRYLLVIQGSPDDVTRTGRLLSDTQADVIALHAHRESVAPRSADEPDETEGAGLNGPCIPQPY
jgi:hypothetical protein